MGDKLANVLIVFIMVIIIGLGGIYYAKVVGSYKYVAEDRTAYSELVENLYDENNGTDNRQSEDNVTIGGVKDNNSKAGYKYNNRYYYNRLSEESKAIYDAIVNNMDKLKTENCTIEINYDFNKVFNNGNGQSLINDYYNDAINAVNLDVPNLFYLDFSKMYLNIKETTSLFSTKYELYINAGNYNNFFIGNFDSSTKVDIAASQIEVAKNQVKTTLVGTDYNKVKILHDWLIDYLVYDSAASNKSSVYGALIEKRGVCEAYSRTFKYILDELGIDNILVTGTATNSNGATEDHMWNYVKIDGKWYAVDPTWDDPIILGGGALTEEIRHRYFLKGSQDFYKNHEEKLTISSSGRVFELPKLQTINY